MYRKLKKEKGITLIALVITIIILLILAGITIGSLTGSGLFEKAKDAKLQTEISNLEEQANLIYSELTVSEYLGEVNTPTMADIVDKLIEKGYKIEQVATSGSAITGIILDKETISLPVNGTEEIKVTYEGSSDLNIYYAIINNKYYKMVLTANGVKVERTPSELDNNNTPETLTAVSSNDNVIIENINGNIITIKGGEVAGTSTITVTYGTYTKICNVSVVKRPTDNSEVVEGVTFPTFYGKIDIIWLKGTTKEVIDEPNVPILASNGETMTPIYWNESNEIKTISANEKWYNYSENKWANARTANESYFVWIPRYAYRITYYENETSTEPTGYYDGYGQWKAEDGEVRLKLEDGVDTVEYNGEKYIVHPAFDNNVEMGGWSNRLSGFWFAKFEMSGLTSTELKSTFGVKSQRSQKMGVQYTNARTATYGYTGTIDPFDNNKSYMNSHMIKNSEWGAMAYLTHSKYGINGKEITKNSEVYAGGGETTAYLTNIDQSTTGNVYGIYDISGGAWERISAFNSVDTGKNFSNTSVGWTAATGLRAESNSTKYATKYNNTTAKSTGNIPIYSYGKTGDATKEVNRGGMNAINETNVYSSWFSNSSNLMSSSSPIINRGGAIDSNAAGLFNYNSGVGTAGTYHGYRTVLVNEEY